MDHEVAFVVVRLIQILLRVNFEHVVAHLETNGLHFRCNILARVFHVAEGLVGGAVEVGQGYLPLRSDLFEYIRWDG